MIDETPRPHGGYTKAFGFTFAASSSLGDKGTDTLRSHGDDEQRAGAELGVHCGGNAQDGIATVARKLFGRRDFDACGSEGAQPGEAQKPWRKSTPLFATRSKAGVRTALHPAAEVCSHDMSSAMAMRIFGRAGSAAWSVGAASVDARRMRCFMDWGAPSCAVAGRASQRKRGGRGTPSSPPDR